jgi:uncharacterized protein with von Willebrand factor type A (vWA) domain
MTVPPEPATPDVSGTTTLLRFLRAARSEGIRISTAESLDAARALEAIGYDDRASLKAALSATLAKTSDEKPIFDAVFDRYFSREGLGGFAPASDDTDGTNASDGEAESELGRLLQSGDEAEILAATEAAGEGAGVSAITTFTQVGFFARRMLERMGIEELEREIERLLASPFPNGRVRGHRMDERRDRLVEEVRAYVERAYRTFARGESERHRDRSLLDASFSRVDRRDIERMRVVVRAMARRLATKYGRVRRREKRGLLDVRKTMRENVANDGVPFRTHWKSRRIEKPRVVALCDVSGSCAGMSQFLLLFLHELNAAIANLHAFAFSGRTVEVSDILERSTIEEAMMAIMRLVGFQSSDYGTSLQDFEALGLARIDRKTTVIVVGDGRTNYANPRIEIFKRVADRAKRVVWLNTEHRSQWGTGDSAMLRYLPHCSIAVTCAKLRDLEAVVSDLLKTA